MHSINTDLPYHINRFDALIGPYSRYLVEMVGTMLLVFTVGTTSEAQRTGAAPELGGLAIGFSLVVLVFFGGHISGAHYNPAVTIGILATWRGKISPVMSIVYIIVQVIGSFFGALLVYAGTNGHTFGPRVDDSTYSTGDGLVVEIVATFLLVTVVLNVATTEAQEDNSYYGLAIGFTVTSMAIAVGGISGGAFNPAVGFGPHIVNCIMGNPMYQGAWIYWVGPILGALLAALFFRITNVQEYREKNKYTQLQQPISMNTIEDLDETSSSGRHSLKKSVQ